MQAAYQIPTQPVYSMDPLSEEAFKDLTQKALQPIERNNRQQMGFLIANIQDKVARNDKYDIVEDFKSSLNKLIDLIEGSKQQPTSALQCGGMVQHLKSIETNAINQTENNKLEQNKTENDVRNDNHHQGNDEALVKMLEAREEAAARLEAANKEGLANSKNYTQATQYFKDAKLQNGLKHDAMEQSKQLNAQNHSDQNQNEDQNKDQNKEQGNQQKPKQSLTPSRRMMLV